MTHMSIRKKLLLSFIGVLLVPVAALLALASFYWRSAHHELEQRFLAEARRALAETEEPEDALRRELELALDGDPLFGRRVHLDLSTTNIEAATLERALGRVIDSAPAFVGAGFITRFGCRWVEGGAETACPDTLASHAVAPGLAPMNAFSDGHQEWLLADSAGGVVAVEYDIVRALHTRELTHGGVVIPVKEGRQWGRGDGPHLERYTGANGEMRVQYDESARPWVIYTAVSAEVPVSLTRRQGGLAVAMPADDVYSGLVRFPYEVGFIVATALLLALALADRLSRRFVGDIERIQGAVAAIGAGDLKRLDPSSNDELGALVRSVNEMASSLAARGVREETAAWRRLVQVLSHEINNTLAPIRSVASTMRRTVGQRLRDGDAGADVDESLRLIVDRVDALAGFIARSAEVAKVPEPQRQLTDFGAVVRGSTIMFAEDAAARAVALDVDVADTRTASIDVRLVERVIVNVVKNAVEAASTRVRVATATHGDDVELVVEDDGPGISADARRSLFVPYFTTKPGGSGIGLALARQIVVAHGGSITAEDREGGGTRMRVTLPSQSGHPYRASA